jgi:hypothetical protein
MMGSDYMMKAIAWLLSLVAIAGVVAGLFGFMVGCIILLFSYGLTTVELEDEIQ